METTTFKTPQMNISTTFPTIAWEEKKINCPKHGVHAHVIQSTISGHEGYWCQLCWLESLGEPLPLVTDQPTSESD